MASDRSSVRSGNRKTVREGVQKKSPRREVGGGGQGTHHHNQAVAVLGRPTYVDFPGLGDTPFGDVVPEGSTASACEVLRGHFEKKEELKARANFLLYQVK